MGPGSFLYKLAVYLHVTSAILGFGSVFFMGLYGKAASEKKGKEGHAISEAANKVGEGVATPFIYAVLVTGILMVLFSKGSLKWSALWIWLAIALFVIALGISHGLHRPNLKAMLALSGELAEMGPPPGAGGGAGDGNDAGPPAGGPPPQAIELEARGKKAAIYGSILNLLVLVTLVLMVWKPGAGS